jgi:hypothetical protein
MNEMLAQAAKSVFVYSHSPRVRRHGPVGYDDYRSYKAWLRDEFDYRCVYCLCRERWEPNGQNSFSVEHALPRASNPERANDYENLLYACCTCNSAREEASLPIDPFASPLAAHLRLTDDGTIASLTKHGAVLIEICRLNRPSLVDFRRRLRWTQIVGQLWVGNKV